MTGASAYRARGRTPRSQETRARILVAVRELLSEGTFHESSVEAVAERAGVARATLYQHFPSRLDLVDAICEPLSLNPALQAVRTAVALADPREALEKTIASSVAFWASEDGLLSQLYDAAAIDPAARDFVDRQRRDRRGEIERLAGHLERSGVLAAGATRARTAAELMVLTSYDAFRELRLTGLADREVSRLLVSMAGRLLLDPQP